MSELKKNLFGEDTSIFSLEASTFLNTKGVLEKMDNYNIIRIFCSHERPIFNNEELNDFLANRIDVKESGNSIYLVPKDCVKY
jgi:hypothetical protein